MHPIILKPHRVGCRVHVGFGAIPTSERGIGCILLEESHDILGVVDDTLEQ